MLHHGLHVNIYLKCENFQTSLIFNLCSFSQDFGKQRKKLYWFKNLQSNIIVQ